MKGPSKHRALCSYTNDTSGKLGPDCRVKNAGLALSETDTGERDTGGSSVFLLTRCKTSMSLHFFGDTRSKTKSKRENAWDMLTIPSGIITFNAVEMSVTVTMEQGYFRPGAKCLDGVTVTQAWELQK